MQVPLLDLKAQYATIRAEVEAPSRSDGVTALHPGPKVEQCEKAIASTATVHTLWGFFRTDALLACLMGKISAR